MNGMKGLNLRTAWLQLASAFAVAAVCGGAAAGAARAVEVSAGWALTNVGLDDDRGGLVVGLGSRTVLAPAVMDLVYALEYVQKRGAQPTWFTDERAGFVQDDAEVTLHVLQPVVLVELSLVPLLLPRPYVGLSIALKLSEQWSAFPGVPSSAWGYKDLDFAAHFGLTRSLGSVRLDLRYSQGLTDQLVVDSRDVLLLKAENPLPGVDEPRAGARLSQWQAAAVLAF